MIFNNLCASAKNKVEEEKTKTTSKVQETKFSDNTAYGESPEDCPVKNFTALCGVSTNDVNPKNGVYTVPLFYRGQFINTLGNIDSTYYLFSSDMKNNEDITTIVVPEGIEVIGYRNPYGNMPKNLTKIILPKSIKALTFEAFHQDWKTVGYTIDISNLGECTYFGERCFTGVKNLEGEFEFNKKEKIFLGKYAFLSSNFSGKQGVLTIPSTITTIPSQCFCGCSQINQLIMHDDIKEIGYSSFEKTPIGENSTLILPMHLKKIGSYAFENTKFNNLQLNKELEEIGDYPFSFETDFIYFNLVSENEWKPFPLVRKLGSGWWMSMELYKYDSMLDWDSNKELRSKYANDKVLILEEADNLEEVGDYAFGYFHKIKGSLFPPNIRKIGKEAFNNRLNCEKKDGDFVGVTHYENLPDSVETLGERWYYIKTVPITFTTLCSENSHLKEIGQRAFASDKYGSSITILSEILTLPETLESIAYHAFDSQPNIKQIIAKKADKPLHIGSATSGVVGYGGDGIFENCKNLESIDFSQRSIESVIGRYFAYDCPKLTTFVYGEGNALKSVGHCAFVGTALESFDFKEGLKEICIGAFMKGGKADSSLLNKQEEATFPSTLEKIGPYAFHHAGMKAITFKSGLKEIQYDCFENCTSATNELILPDTLEYLGSFALDHTPNFSNTSITIPASLKVIGEGGDPTYKAYREYNAGSHNFYNCAAQNKEFIVEEGNQWFVAIDGILFGKDSNGNVTRLISFPRCIKNKKNSPVVNGKYIIPEGITTLDELCFNRCIGINEIVLPNSFIINPNLPESTKTLYEYGYWGSIFPSIKTSYINTHGNTLSVGIYVWHTLQNVTCKEDNPNYKSIEGLVYSKDGKSLWYLSYAKKGNVSIAEGTERIEHGAIFSEDTSIATTSLTIPASVTFIDDDCLKLLNNHYMKSKCTVTIDSANTTYKITDNKIVKI